MRKLKAITMCLAYILFAGVVSAQDAKQSGWEYIRTVVSAADSSTLAATTKDWGQRATYTHGIAIPSGTETVLISAIGNHASDPDDGTATVRFYMYRSGGPAQIVGTYTFTFGDLRCNLKPRDSTQQGAKSKWAESAVLVSENWISTPQIVGSGTDTCVMLKIPTYGYAYITAEVTAITAAHTVDILMSSINQSRSDVVSTVLSSPSKTLSVSTTDAWQAVTAATTTVGSTADFSNAYGDSVLYIEAAQIEATAHDGGAGIVVQVSVDGRSWVDYTASTDLNLTADTAATTTTVGAVTADVNTVVDLTDSATGDFDVQARCWFIKDGTIANSETVFTKSDSANAVTLMNAVQKSHTTGSNVYDRVDQFAVNIREGVTYARVVYKNADADCDIAVRSWISKVTEQ